MNKTVAIAALAVAACGLSSTAWSAPLMWFDPVTGGIYFHNDHSGPLANMSVISASGNLLDASQLLDIPGTVKDDTELPFAFTYLGLPVGYSFAGNIVKSGGGWGDIRYEYRLNSLLEPLIRGAVPDLGDPRFPEPTSCVMAAMSVSAIIATARRARGRRRVA